MSAEAIARFVADMRRGDIVCPVNEADELANLATLRYDADGDPLTLASATRGTIEIIVDQGAPVVNVTALNDRLSAAGPRQLNCHEDLACIAPPWESALFCYVTASGGVRAVLVQADMDNGYTANIVAPFPASDVWCTLVLTVFVGGLYHGERVKPHGPMVGWLVPLDRDGRVLGIVQSTFDRVNAKPSETAVAVTLSALDLLNARNVEIGEPVRERHERRRIERLGVTVHEIVVLPAGKVRRGSGLSDLTPGGRPLGARRGHFAHYGPEYNAGLLFGRLAGRFWIPEYVAGDGDARLYRLAVRDTERPELARP